MSESSARNVLGKAVLPVETTVMDSSSSDRDLMEYVDAQLKMNISPAAMKTDKERMINNARMIERRSTRRHQIQVFDLSARI